MALVQVTQVKNTGERAIGNLKIVPQVSTKLRSRFTVYSESMSALIWSVFQVLLWIWWWLSLPLEVLRVMFLALVSFIWLALGGFWCTHCEKTWLNSPTNCSRNWTYSALSCCGWTWRCCGLSSGCKGTAPAHSSTLRTIWDYADNPHDPPSNNKREFVDDIRIRRQKRVTWPTR